MTRAVSVKFNVAETMYTELHEIPNSTEIVPGSETACGN